MKSLKQITYLSLGIAVWLSLSGCAWHAVALKPLPSASGSNFEVPQLREELQVASSPSSPDVVGSAPASAGLSEAQKTSLSELSIPVVIPAYVPGGFQLSEAIANSCTAGSPQTSLCREGPNYTLVYRNAQNTCFLVRAVGGGVGGGAREFEFQTRTTLLGDVSILFGEPSGENQHPTAEQLQVLQPNLSSFPTALQSPPSSSRFPYYWVSAGDDTYDQETYACQQNANLTPLELEKIVQSLVLLE
ncbi:hypothetical protein NDA01_30055 [Trichocoleus desertorum AS-A10]|uniref:hypothetical protein n=1 Tax=Trichocoleus desertorum TaxID=1481672 RepID=UPI003299E1B5